MNRLQAWLVAIAIACPVGAAAADPASGAAAGASPRAAAQPAADLAGELLTRAGAVVNAHGSGMRDVEIITRDPNGKEKILRGREARRVVDGRSSVVLVLDEPPSVRGFAILAAGGKDKAHEMWTYVPPVDRVRKLELIGAAQSFLGTEITFADLGLFDLSERGTVRLAGESMIDGHTVKNIEIVPADQRAYSRILTYVTADGVPVRRDYFDLAGRAWRVLSYDTVKSPDGRTRLRGFTAKDMQTGYETELRYGDFERRDDFVDDVFAPESLGSVAMERRLEPSPTAGAAGPRNEAPTAGAPGEAPNGAAGASAESAVDASEASAGDAGPR